MANIIVAFNVKAGDNVTDLYYNFSFNGHNNQFVNDVVDVVDDAITCDVYKYACDAFKRLLELGTEALKSEIRQSMEESDKSD